MFWVVVILGVLGWCGTADSHSLAGRGTPEYEIYGELFKYQWLMVFGFQLRGVVGSATPQAAGWWWCGGTGVRFATGYFFGGGL